MSFELSLVICRVGSGLDLRGCDSSCYSMVSAQGLLLWLGLVVSLVGWTMSIFWVTLTICMLLVQFIGVFLCGEIDY